MLIRDTEWLFSVKIKRNTSIHRVTNIYYLQVLHNVVRMATTGLQIFRYQILSLNCIIYNVQKPNILQELYEWRR